MNELEELLTRINRLENEIVELELRIANLEGNNVQIFKEKEMSDMPKD